MKTSYVVKFNLQLVKAADVGSATLSEQTVSRIRPQLPLRKV